MLTRLAAAVLGTLIAAVPAFAAAATLSENDYQHVVLLESPAISPDGKRAVVIVSKVNWNEDRRDDDIVAVDIATRAQRTLTYDRKEVSDPSFSPDGTRLAFIAQEGTGDDAQSQVFVMPL